ncbi:protein immune deficiency [Melitaea cinxia]|uniref:protein immune deficiency n=1 Tax=Melitaea cinxia TaxID=113334 RepID=UPI001E274153|nr:protein immune deficiency [Melitaea cinxia]
MANKLSAKFLEIFRNIKSDAEPRPPRKGGMSNAASEADNENEDSNQENIFVKQNKKKSKPNYQKSFSTPSKESSDFPEEEEFRRRSTASTVHTQASGNVINIVNSTKVHCGNEIIYYMGPVHGNPGRPKKYQPEDDEEETVQKTNVIILLLESDQKPEHDYIDYISKHLGENWQRFFRKLGYSQGQIETVEYDNAKLGVAEARYKLLLDWIRNDVDGTLGKLANLLWTEGERQIVKELAAMYTKSSK